MKSSWQRPVILTGQDDGPLSVNLSCQDDLGACLTLTRSLPLLLKGSIVRHCSFQKQHIAGARKQDAVLVQEQDIAPAQKQDVAFVQRQEDIVVQKQDAFRYSQNKTLLLFKK